MDCKYRSKRRFPVDLILELFRDSKWDGSQFTVVKATTMSGDITCIYTDLEPVLYVRPASSVIFFAMFVLSLSIIFLYILDSSPKELHSSATHIGKTQLRSSR